MKKVVITSIIILLIIALTFTRGIKKAATTNEDDNTTPDITTSYYPTDIPTNTESITPPNDGIDDAVNSVSLALQASNASQFQSLIIDDVVLGSESGVSKEARKVDAINWLNSHWSSNLHYLSKHYIEHFGFWEIETAGWINTPAGAVTFKLFRYDANGQRKVFSGEWKVYAVIYK